ncbi:MAG: hypothetical protein NVS9B12_06340 [Vulcanimicrobiaceae bacterium]
MSENVKDAWHHRTARIHESCASVVLNAGLYDAAPVKDCPQAYLLTIALLHPDPQGLASADEASTLGGIEAQISSDARNLGLIKAGSITGRNVRQIVFYGAPSIDLQPLVAFTTRKNRPYRFSLISKADPRWDTYWSLYPPR